MKTLLACALAGACLSTAAFAQAPSVEAVQITGASPRFALPAQQYNIWYDEFDTVRGDYRLSNGGGMNLSMYNNRMYASISGVGRNQLVAVTPYSFVSRDGRTRITLIDPDSRAPGRPDATIELLTPPAVAGLAPTITVLLASR